MDQEFKAQGRPSLCETLPLKYTQTYIHAS